ncbi:P-loop containing nucleoside triphosphate hydrolase protein [Rickenella mellea]|uniref:P-loop containing nucleoside triphosphate hydrolase protein n=1 Tax=Rickenella mellea TaxID=50990 RepID=A0A4R5XG96_9AGAM|nr:P-loop containing nucleoside triphosphate hydrolase protein [Rickenella mellea]
MELNPKKKMVYYYTGNYKMFVRTKNDNEVNQMKAYNKQQEEIAHTKKFTASDGMYANLTKQPKLKQKIIDKMEAADLIEKVESQRPLRFNFEYISKLPPPILAFNDVAFSYSGKKEDYLHQNLSIAWTPAFAILGANGTGKSTLLNLITGLLQRCSSTISKHMSLKLAKYSQHSADQLPKKYPDKDVMAWRAQLARFGLRGQHQSSMIRHFSDGLSNRVVFAQLAMDHPRILLLLDEPTNHLDMTSIDAFARAIKGYEGGAVIVSHDFQELREVKNKKVRNLTREDITIIDYQKLLVNESTDALERSKLFGKAQQMAKT